MCRVFLLFRFVVCWWACVSCRGNNFFFHLKINKSTKLFFSPHCFIFHFIFFRCNNRVSVEKTEPTKSINLESTTRLTPPDSYILPDTSSPGLHTTMSSWTTGFTTKVEIAQPQPSSGSIKGKIQLPINFPFPFFALLGFSLFVCVCECLK